MTRHGRRTLDTISTGVVAQNGSGGQRGMPGRDMRLVIGVDGAQPPHITLKLYKEGRSSPQESGTSSNAIPEEEVQVDSLYTVLTSGADNARLWRRAMDDDAVRQIIVDIGCDQYRSLPWEDLHDGPWSFRSVRTPAFRARWPLPTSPTVDRLLPVRILVVLAIPHDGDDVVDGAGATEESLCAVYRGLGSASPHLWQVEVLRNPSRDDFTAALERGPQVLHVVGHGAVRPSAPTTVPPATSQIRPDGAVEIRPRRTREDPWILDSTAVGQIFREAIRIAPPLVVLSSCTNNNSWPDVVDAFIVSGAAGVVSFRGEVEQRAEQRFTEGLYQALRAGLTVPEAVAQARDRVRGRHGQFSLTMAADPDSVEFCSITARQWFEDNPWKVGPARVLVDRVMLRPRVLGAIRVGGAPVSLLTGRTRSGLSAVVQSCITTFLAEGGSVVHIDCGPDESVCTAWSLVERAGTSDDAAEAAAGRQDDRTAADPPPEPPDAEAIRRLRDMLRRRAQAAASGLTVVIDHVHRFDDLVLLHHELVRPLIASEGHRGRLRLVLVGNEDEVAELGGAVGVHRIEVAAVARRNAPDLARELVAKDWRALRGDQDLTEDKVEAYRSSFVGWAENEAARGTEEGEGHDPLSFEEFISQYIDRRIAHGLPALCRM